MSMLQTGSPCLSFRRWVRILTLNIGIVLTVICLYTYLISEWPFLNAINNEVTKNETNTKRTDKLGYHTNKEEIQR